VIEIDSVSPRIEGNGRGSEIDGVPQRACAKDGFVDCAGGAIGAAEMILPDVMVAAGMAGGASSTCQSNMARRAKAPQNSQRS